MLHGMSCLVQIDAIVQPWYARAGEARLEKSEWEGPIFVLILFYHIVQTVATMPRRTKITNASLSPRSSHRNHRRGRGGSGSGCCDGTCTTPSKKFSSVFRFIALVATMLPAHVAGQSMTCWGGIYVRYSADTLALFNNIAQGVTTFRAVGSLLH